jgi:ribonucleoside-diphosphate reductase subunit M2
MATQLTPSKQVRCCHVVHDQTRRRVLCILTGRLQAASSLKNLKMNDSPVKIAFEPTGKENISSFAPTVDLAADDKLIVAAKPTVQETPKVASGIKELEANEPLLQENPHRFVLFPIKYHEVSGTVQRLAR